MAACLLVGRLDGRRVASTDALGFAILVIVAAEPAALQHFGFRLSVAATAAMGLRILAGGLAYGAEAMLDIVVACSRLAAIAPFGGPVALPSASAALALLYAFGLVLVTRRGNQRRIAGVLSTIIAVSLALRAPPAPRYAQVLAMDVGQGDALLLTSHAGAVLIDAGGYPSIDYDTGYRIVEPELHRLGIDHLDAVAVTHDHADHAGGAATILRDFRVAELWQGATPFASATASGLLELARSRQTAALAPTGLERAIAGCRWRSLAPPDNELRAGALRVSNEASLVLTATCGEKHLLLTSDAGAAAEHNLDVGAITGAVLKVGHHGSASATSESLLRRLQPRHALISVGATNPWSLPRSGVLGRLRAHRTAVYRTDHDGAVTIELEARIRVRGERWRRGAPW